MKSLFTKLATAAIAALLAASPAGAFDRDLADAYAQLFEPVKGAKAGKKLHLIKPEQFVKEVRSGKQYVTVDIRTPGETRFFTSNMPGNLVIPLSKLFKHEELAKLPKDKPIVVICKSGIQASAAVTGLRRIGFEESYVLNGGFTALSRYLGAPQANKPLGQKTAAR